MCCKVPCYCAGYVHPSRGRILYGAMNRDLNKLYENCILCPRKCGVNRLKGEKGFCREGSYLAAARAALHFWEEPCISGQTGSGAVFFSGCNMGCVFCQYYEIASFFLALYLSFRCNSYSYYKRESAKDKGLKIPVVYNTSAYENVETIKMLDGLIDIYLPDCKYYSSDLSFRFSKAGDYFDRALDAIGEMVRQTQRPRFYCPDMQQGSGAYLNCTRTISADEYNDIVTSGEESSDYTGPLMRRGTIVRHLLLPGHLEDSIGVVTRLHERFGDDIYISLMNQYTPMPHSTEYPELVNKVDDTDYERLIDYAIDIGVEYAFIQGGETDNTSFIPAFDYTGL